MKTSHDASSSTISNNIDTVHSVLRYIDDIKSSKTTNNMKRPFITLAYAQSIDGKIALMIENGNDTSSNFPLSCEESLILTHALRSAHDAVLVGGNTFEVDDPRLNVRLWESKHQQKQPRPIVLDTHLSRVKHNCRASHLIICCSYQAAKQYHEDKIRRRADWTVVGCSVDQNNGKLDLQDVLCKLLLEHNIKSIMVEGGALVLSEFLGKGYVDCLCVTVAPKIVGKRGVPVFNSDLQYDDDDSKQYRLQNPFYCCLGADSIITGRYD